MQKLQHFLFVFSFLYLDKDRLISIAEETKSPYSESSRTMFDYISKNTSSDDMLIFSKPRALAYFSKRKTILISEKFSFEKQIPEHLKDKKMYFLICSDLINQLNVDYFLSNNQQLEIVKKTDFFSLYSVKSLKNQPD